MLFVMFEAMEAGETTILFEKSTFLDGRPSLSSSAGDCDYNTSSAPAGAKLELGLSLAKNNLGLSFIQGNFFLSNSYSHF